jgi:hypothetical protein
MAGKSWGTQDAEGLTPEDRKLLELYRSAENLEMPEIAKRMGRTQRSIANRLLKLRKRLEGTPNEVKIRGSTAKRGVDVKEEGNYLTVESKGFRIKTLEQLIDVCEIDLETWIMQRHKINTWEVGAKVENKDLEFVDGVMTGTVYAEGLTIETLFQVTAWLIRKEPIALRPVISPVHINFGSIKPINLKKVDNIHRAIVLPDTQFGFYRSLRTNKLTPFHDRRALDIALQITQHYYVDQTILLGDLMDLADWSDKFIRSPNMYWTTQPAAIEAKWWLAQFKAATDGGVMKIIEGNHDKRMGDRIIKHMTEAFDLRSVDGLELPPLISVPRILALHDLDIEWIGDYPNGQVWITDDLVCEHGDVARGKSGATVSSMVQDAHNSKIVGHIHRIESATKTIHVKDGAKTVEVWSIGCLCRIDGLVPAKKKRNNWQQALAMVEFTDDGDIDIDPIPIKEGRAMFRGQVYEARDRLDDLREATVGSKAEWNW